MYEQLYRQTLPPHHSQSEAYLLRANSAGNARDRRECAVPRRAEHRSERLVTRRRPGLRRPPHHRRRRRNRRLVGVVVDRRRCLHSHAARDRGRDACGERRPVLIVRVVAAVGALGVEGIEARVQRRAARRARLARVALDVARRLERV